MNTLCASKEIVRIINDRRGRLGKLLERVRKAETTGFHLLVGNTETSDIEGISAAGASAEARRLTPRYDAEALVLGTTREGLPIPVSPAGIVSPVVLSRASLQVLESSIDVVDCGSFFPPRIDNFKAGSQPARCLSTGDSLPESVVRELFEKGKEYGQRAAEKSDLVIIGECVPGGTTTAMAVLTALGYDARDSVSNSVPVSNHRLRWRMIRRGFKSAGLPMPSVKQSYQRPAGLGAFEIMAHFGDPMQPFAAGMALAASRAAMVVLGGGSQMLTVFALLEDLAATSPEFEFDRDNLAVITTKWVALDPSANTRKLAEEIGAPLACPMLNMLGSCHEGLQAYEQGHVKEGVGAGASMALASHIKDIPLDTLLASIDLCYKELVPFPH
ncbi:MAG: nicotinate mononucleotide-dependent phosphoribosyltransferase CobT [Candidatus Obscuribacterales bacterium]